MGWQISTHRQLDASFLPLQCFLCFIFVAKESNPEILVGNNLGLCGTLNSSYTHIIHSIVKT